MDKNCYCYACNKSIASLGVASHRAMHRRRKENCTIRYSNGKILHYQFEQTEGDKSDERRTTKNDQM